MLSLRWDLQEQLWSVSVDESLQGLISPRRRPPSPVSVLKVLADVS